MPYATGPRLIAVLALTLLVGCAVQRPEIPVNRTSVRSGEAVMRGSSILQLLGTPLRIGEPLPETALVDGNLRTVDLSQLRGEILLLSTVPSVDTQVCERQTHALGEDGDMLPTAVRRITISRDLPFAHKRFADEAGLDDILFLSDYRDGEFGLETGLLVDEIKLLARAIIIVDREGVVRYIQVVPQLAELPDMERAFVVAGEMALQ